LRNLPTGRLSCFWGGFRQVPPGGWGVLMARASGVSLVLA
jgi:hypothetical protein